MAKIDRNTPNPEGGVFERDDSGELNGIIRESAGMVYRLVPEATFAVLPSTFLKVPFDDGFAITSL